MMEKYIYDSDAFLLKVVFSTPEHLFWRNYSAGLGCCMTSADEFSREMNNGDLVGSFPECNGLFKILWNFTKRAKTCHSPSII